MNNKFPKRKPNRLKNYNYSEDGAYFVTICTKNKEKFFWTDEYEKDDKNFVIKSTIKLSSVGKIAEKSIENIQSIYEGVYVEKYVIMPNHIHILLKFDRGRLLIAPTTDGQKLLSKIVRGLKSYVTKEAKINIWQKSFHDRVVRNEDEYLKIWKYIDDNPATWMNDELFM